MNKSPNGARADGERYGCLPVSLGVHVALAVSLGVHVAQVTVTDVVTDEGVVARATALQVRRPATSCMSAKHALITIEHALITIELGWSFRVRGPDTSCARFCRQTGPGPPEGESHSLTRAPS